jgi:hypothetical protein
LKFAWQIGYAALTVSASQVEAVQQYFENQEEYRELLERAGLEYGEEYLWG